jgi:hypothetical protein
VEPLERSDDKVAAVGHYRLLHKGTMPKSPHLHSCSGDRSKCIYTQPALTILNLLSLQNPQPYCPLISSKILHTHNSKRWFSSKSQITNADFEKEVLRSKEPVLVFFWAIWSGPSSFVRPLLDA